MSNHAAYAQPRIDFSETFEPIALLLAGVPMVTVFVMAAVRYVASGTF